MVKVYIISRYRADNRRQLEFNKAVARYFCRQIIDEGKVPVAPHIYYTQFLDDDYQDDRELGLKLGLNDLQDCQEFLVVVIDGIISDGMKAELEEVTKLGLHGCIVNMTKQEIKEAMRVVR